MTPEVRAALVALVEGIPDGAPIRATLRRGYRRLPMQPGLRVERHEPDGSLTIRLHVPPRPRPPRAVSRETSR